MLNVFLTAVFDVDLDDFVECHELLDCVATWEEANEIAMEYGSMGDVEVEEV